jgi:hypothetical protein
MQKRKIIYIIALVVMELFAPVDGNSVQAAHAAAQETAAYE